MTQPPVGGIDPVDLDRFLGSIGHNRWLGHHFHAQGPGWLELAMPWQTDIAEDEAEGGIAGSAIASLLDNATGAAAWLRRGGILPQVTINLRVEQIRRPRARKGVIARCECHAIAGSIAYVRGVAYDERADDPVAQATGCYMLLEGAPL